MHERFEKRIEKALEKIQASCQTTQVEEGSHRPPDRRA